MEDHSLEAITAPVSSVGGAEGGGSIRKRDLPCCVCGSELNDLLFEDELGDLPPSVDYSFSEHTRKTFRIVRCRVCGLIFTNPMPHMAPAYSENVDHVYLRSTPQRRRTAALAVARIRRHVASGRLLDIGCATGIFLDEAARYFSVEGIELSAWAADIACRRHKVMRQPLTTSNGAVAVYDVVTLWGVIEHFEEPMKEIAAIFAAMKPGGLLAIYTGDADSWMARLLGKAWWWYQGMHLIYFSRTTLGRLLTKAGFEIVGTETYQQYFKLSTLSSSLNRYRIGKLLAPILTAKAIGDIMIRLVISGEMVMYARKPGS